MKNIERVNNPPQVGNLPHCLTVLLLSTMAVLAQAPATQAMVALARSEPPEIFADTIVRLAEGGLLPAGDQRRELLDEAFRAAGRAQEPVRLIAASGLAPDTRAIFRAKATELKLDALSLQSRVLKLVVQTDAKAARHLFESLPHPALEPRSCEDPLIADASAYYEMAAAVAGSSFKDEERQLAPLLQAVLAGANSPGEVAAFTDSLARLSLNDADLKLLLDTLAAKLGTVATDYRSFTTSVNRLEPSLELLTTRARERKFDTRVLVSGVRRFLTRQMSAPRCDEDFGDGRPAVEWFNAKFRGDLPMIGEDEIRPSQRRGSFSAPSYFTTPEAERISEAFGELRIAPGEGPRAEAERTAGEWRAMLSDFLRLFSNWNPVGADIDVLHQKLSVLRGLLELVPAGPDRGQILGQCVAILRSSSSQAQYPAEWWFEVKSLAGAAGPDLPKLIESFRASGDTGLALFAAWGQ